MGMFLVAYLYCDGDFDGCECQVHNQDGSGGFAEASFGDSQFETKQAYKAAMKKCGWLFRKGNKLAYCPNCRGKLLTKEK